VVPSALTDPFIALTDISPLIAHIQKETTTLRDSVTFQLASKHAITLMQKVFKQRYLSCLDWQVVLRTLGSIEKEMGDVLNVCKVRAKAVIARLVQQGLI
jgi:hypothetical protein